MGKVSDALNKAKKQAASPQRHSLSDVAINKREEKKPIALKTHTQPVVEVEQSENLGHEEMDRRIAGLPRNINRDLQIESIQTSLLPDFDASRIDPNLIAYSSPHSYEAEQFRMLRTNVLFPKSGKPARSILVASTAPSEGKSFVAANLAISIAQNVDKHVLLMDCDMRKPSVHKLFGFGPIAGLSDYLMRGQSLSSLIQRSFIDRLSILPGGAPPVNPAELLSSGRMKDLLREVSQRYNDRFIVIDSPPIQLTAESKVLAKFAHGVLLVARFGRTDIKTALGVINKIGSEKFIGIVGNFADRKWIKKNYGTEYSGYAGYYGRNPESQ